jgi:hypothetical protein
MTICSHDSVGCINRRHRLRGNIVKTGFMSYGILVLSLIPACIAGVHGGWPAAAVAWVAIVFIGGGLYGLFAQIFGWPKLRLDDLPVIDGWLP